MHAPEGALQSEHEAERDGPEMVDKSGRFEWIPSEKEMSGWKVQQETCAQRPSADIL